MIRCCECGTRVECTDEESELYGYGQHYSCKSCITGSLDELELDPDHYDPRPFYNTDKARGERCALLHSMRDAPPDIWFMNSVNFTIGDLSTSDAYVSRFFERNLNTDWVRMKLAEECSELATAILQRHNKGPGTKDFINSEVADVINTALLYLDSVSAEEFMSILYTILLKRKRSVLK